MRARAVDAVTDRREAPRPVSQRNVSRIASRLTLFVVAFAIAGLAAEFVYRAVRSEPVRADAELGELKKTSLELRDARAALGAEPRDAAASERARARLAAAGAAVARCRQLPNAELADVAAIEAAIATATERIADPVAAIAAVDAALEACGRAARKLAGHADAGNLHTVHQQYYRDGARERIEFMTAVERGLLVEVRPSPRTRHTWAPNSTFYICYDGSRQPYFDELGCVRCDFNSRGIRDREELCEPKPPGQRRIVCIGDSFTFGWGVRIEDAWTRLVEGELRKADDGIRLVNCGASGALYVDEYEVGLRERFVAFEPDAVLVTLCLNDLLPITAMLSHDRPVERRAPLGSRLLQDLVLRFGGGDAYPRQSELTWPEGVDVVGDLLAMGPDYYAALQALHRQETREMMWAGEGPQRALRAMRDWCRERSLPFGVALWPLFQGLGPDERYPFAKMHTLVAEFCAMEGIPFVDLLPSLRGRPTPELWVSPADYHGNDVAHRLATPRLVEFVRSFALR